MRTYAQQNPVDPPDRPSWVDGIDNPYLHGPYTPVISEVTAVDLEVVAGEIPPDLYGAYLRNGPNPVLAPKGMYHWFDGDGMVHGVYFRDGRASYVRKWVRTRALHDEIERGTVELSGIMGPFDLSRVGDGRRTVNPDYCKDTANTTLNYFNGRILAQWYNAGRVLRARPAHARHARRGDFRRRARHDAQRPPEGRSAQRRLPRLRLRRLQVLPDLLRGRRRRTAQAPHAGRPAGAAPAARHDVHAELHDPPRLPALPRRQRAAGARDTAWCSSIATSRRASA